MFFARLCLFVGIVCIGFSAIFVRLADVPGVVSAFYRVLIAAVALLPFWLARRPDLPDRRNLFLSAVAGVVFGIDLAFWNVALFRTNAASATVLAYLAPIWVGLGAMALLKERLRRLYWPGTIIALAGMVVIVGPEKLRTMQLGPGNTLAIISSFFYAAYLLIAQTGRKRSDALSFTTISVLFSAATLFLACLLRQERLVGFSYESWAALLALGLISHLAGWLSVNYALGHIRASTVSVTLLGQPVITALVAVPLLSEPLGAGQVAGGALILTGIYLVNRT